MPVKNYGFIIHSQRPDLKDYTSRDPIKKLAKIEYNLVTKSPLHVGNGLVYQKGSQVGRGIIRNADKTPIIPGSTLKGVCRNNFNLIVKNTCMFQCKFRFPKYTKVCKTCDLFGTSSLASRIRFQDAVAQNKTYTNSVEKVIKIPHLMEPKIKKRYHQKYYHNIEYDPGNTGEVPIWTLPPGITFKGTIIIENFNKFELKAVLLALNLRPQILIGGGKNLGLGRCLIDLDNSLLYKYNGIGEKLEAEARASASIENWKEDNLIKENVINEIRKSRGEPYHI